jgi:hypothetical protein
MGMSTCEKEDLLVACVCYIAEQRALIDALASSGHDPVTIATVMAAELDQLSAAVRDFPRDSVATARQDPSE